MNYLLILFICFDLKAMYWDEVTTMMALIIIVNGIHRIAI